MANKISINEEENSAMTFYNKQGRPYLLTLDVEGGVVGCGHLPRGQACGHTLEVARVKTAIHCCKFEVPVLHEAALGFPHCLAVLHPRVSHVSRFTDLTAQHGTATMQRILRLGLFGKVQR